MEFLRVGTVLSVDGFKGFWKIMGEPTNALNCVSQVYPVKKCSKSGKEYRDTNGFFIATLHARLRNGEARIVSYSDVGTKADIDNGIYDGKNKRRIQHLKASIERMQKELARLENKTS